MSGDPASQARTIKAATPTIALAVKFQQDGCDLSFILPTRIDFVFTPSATMNRHRGSLMLQRTYGQEIGLASPKNGDTVAANRCQPNSKTGSSIKSICYGFSAINAALAPLVI